MGRKAAVFTPGRRPRLPAVPARGPGAERRPGEGLSPLPGRGRAWCGGRMRIGMAMMLDTGMGTARERLAGPADGACRQPVTARGLGLTWGVQLCPVSCSP